MAPSGVGSPGAPVIAAVDAEYRPIFVSTEDGLTLEGHLALPRDGAAVHPAVLLLAGSGPINRYENIGPQATADGKPALLFEPIERALLAQGIAVMSYDKRGITTRPEGVFENPEVYATGTGKALASDALRAFDLLRARGEVDPSRLGLIGHSEGTILAMKVAEARPEARAILALGLFTRPFAEIIRYQTITKGERLFRLMDADGDGELSQAEYAAFAREPGFVSLPWPELTRQLDATGDGRVSEQEWRFSLEQNFRGFLASVADGSAPWSQLTPRQWFRDYVNEGDFLPRWLKLCARTRVFQGEVDIQTPFEDAILLRAACAGSGTPLAGFSSYAGLGHGFSPRAGLKGWRDTIGPLEPRVALDVARAAAEGLRPSELTFTSRSP